MPVNQEHFLQELRDSLNDIRDGIREGLSVVNSRLTAIDNRLQSGEDRFQRLETRVLSGSPAPGGNGGGREAASNGNSSGNGGEYYTVSVGKRTVLSVPKETMGRLRKWAVVILACLITGNADRLYALIRTTVRATIEATVPVSSASGVPAIPMPPEH